MPNRNKFSSIFLQETLDIVASLPVLFSPPYPFTPSENLIYATMVKISLPSI